MPGELLEFADPSVGFSVVGDYEPRKHYRWTRQKLITPDREAWVLVGRNVAAGSAELEAPSWRSADDPAFGPALDVVSELQTASQSAQDWPRFFTQQAAYLLLWSCVERFAALAYGPALGPEEKVRRLEADSEFEGLLRSGKQKLEIDHKEIQLDHGVVDSRDPTSRYRFETRPLQYLRQVRNNLSHRGKSAWREAVLVEQSLFVLNGAFRDLIRRRVIAQPASLPDAT